MIAAFQVNQAIFEKCNLFYKQQILDIIMLGMYPTFYCMNMTRELLNHIENGHCPHFVTDVWQHSIPNTSTFNVMDAMVYQHCALNILHTAMRL